MSSSFVVESQGSNSKKDDTLIIVVNDDGTISVDQETLQNLIMNQSDANVSVVRVGQSEGDDANGDLTLTVDPPHFERLENSRSTLTSATATSDVAGLVDPFMEMDPEQLEKLETALQSEQAKQILGENVTAMLDMLTVEEQQKSIKYCIELDHCYTSRTSPTDPKPADPLPIAHSPDIDNFEYKHSALSQQSSSMIPTSIDVNVVEGNPPAAQSLSPTTPPAQSQQSLLPKSSTPPPSSPLPATPAARSNQSARKTKRSSIGRGRKVAATVSQSTTGTPKSAINLRNSSAGVPQSSSKGTPSGRFEAEAENEASSLSESSISEPPSDDDSDFGPRAPRRGGVRARGGRKGLTTRGGSMMATRRRSSNKQMDVEQVRRLDMEMAAAVDAMKSPEKSERPDKFNPTRVKKQPRILGSRKKEESLPSQGVTLSTTSSLPPSSSPPPLSPMDQESSTAIPEKPLQTTNQVKANLISANMIKGDMILTKPGQSRNNQRVVLVKKRVAMRANEMRNDLESKKQPVLVMKGGKTLPAQIQTKLGTSDDGKLISVGGTTILQNIQSQQQKPKTVTIVPTIASAIVSPQSSNENFNLPGISPEQREQKSSSQVDNPSCHMPSSQQNEPSIQLCAKTPNIPSQLPSPSPSPSATSSKIKTPEIKKDKKRSESELATKLEETSKSVEVKTPVDVTKKHPKKDQRKFPAVFADALGPALFSTPDIIRRVGAEAKGHDVQGTQTSTAALVHGTPTSITPPFNDSTSGAATITSPIKSLDLPSQLDTSEKSQGTSSSSMETEMMHDVRQTNNESLVKIPMADEALPGDSGNELKPETVPTLEEIEPSLHPATNPPLTADPGLPRSANVSVVQSEIPPEQSEIDNEEHLLAALDMESGKHDEQLLAEALLLQEELSVDLGDHAALVDPTISEPLLTTSTFETPLDGQGPSMAALDSMKSLLHEVAPSAATTAITETPKKKDEKEPIQIIRGGRVITLPPIEAPATRSKRLQAKSETPQKFAESPKKDERTIRKQSINQQKVSHQRKKSIGENDATEGEKIKGKSTDKIHDNQNERKIDNRNDDDDDYDEDDEGDKNSDSEDDPHRLWCICKQPHNNRFMISCDICEDWFHGRCVNVTKAEGEEMEEKGMEWACPNCVKKKDPGQSRPLKSLVPPAKSPKIELPPRVSVEERTPQLPSPRMISSSSEKLKAPDVLPAPSAAEVVPTLSVTQCVVCKKEARNSSIYCSDACILTHAQETLTKENKPTTTPPAKAAPGTSEGHKSSSDARVIVFEKKTGKVLTGTDAPTTSNLKTWLKENPTFEVLRPNNLNTLQIAGKTVTAIQTHGPGKLIKTGQGTGQAKMIYTKIAGSKQTVLAANNKKVVVLSGGQQQRASLSPKTIQQKSQQVTVSTGKSPIMRQTTIKMVPQQKASPTSQGKQGAAKKQEVAKAQMSPQQQPKSATKTPTTKKAEAEPIRLNVRKTLAEQLSTRIKASEDLQLGEDEINELALNIELELYKYFRDTGAKYKAKYRSLVFNIKDTKNLTLYRKIADRSLTPDAVVRLSPEEMASQELAEWREKETKHQLEMIKKNELDLMSQAKSIVVKTHKGELIIENEGGIDHVDPKTPVQDIVTALNSHDEPVGEDAKDENSRGAGGNSSASEDSKRPGLATNLEGKKKLDKDKERSGDKRSRSMDKEDKVTRVRSTDDEDERRRRRKRKRSHSRGRRRRSKDRERSRDRKSAKSKESKREREKDSKDREREKTGKESRQRGGKDRQKKSRGSKARDHRKSKDEETGRGSRRDDGERKNDGTVGQTGNHATGDLEKPIEDRLWRHVEDETTTTTNAIFDGNDSDVSDREPSSTVNIKTPDINDDPERYKDTVEIGNVTEDSTPASSTPVVQDPEQDIQKQSAIKAGASQTVWRGFVNMVDVAKFFINAQEVSGHAKDLMEDLPDTVDVVGRISHETVWDYISKMKKTGSKEILIIRLTAANDEEKIPYITLYSYLNSRSRLGVVGNVSKNIKDFYIMPFSRQSQLPAVLLPLVGPGFEDQRPHLLLGIIVRNKRKRVASNVVTSVPVKISKKDDGDSSKEKNHGNSRHHNHHHHHSQQESSMPDSPRPIHKGLLLESLREKQSVTQLTLESLNKAQVGMSRAGSTIIDNTTISKLVPELSSKIDLTDSPKDETSTEKMADGTTSDEIECDDGDEPYSPGGATDVDEPDETETRLPKSDIVDISTFSASSTSAVVVPTKNAHELQRKMDELNRQIEEQKQQIQTISSSFLGDATTTLPGLGLDPPEATDMEEAYSPTDARSFTPPPPGMAKFAQPILDKVSDITIPANLQEILANVKRQESSKVDPYLPSKPSATFLTSVTPSVYPAKTSDKYTPTFINKSSNPAVRAPATGASVEKPIFDNSSPVTTKETTKSTLRSLSDLDLIKKAEEELAAVAAAEASSPLPPIIPPQPDLQCSPVPPLLAFSSPPPPTLPPPPLPPSIIGNANFKAVQDATLENVPYPPPSLAESDTKKSNVGNFAMDQPKPPGLEDEDLPVFPTTPPSSVDTTKTVQPKFIPKSGVVVSVTRKVNEDGSTPTTVTKTPRTKSRWGQGPTD